MCFGSRLNLLGITAFQYFFSLSSLVFSFEFFSFLVVFFSFPVHQVVPMFAHKMGKTTKGTPYIEYLKEGTSG